jgi:hypothetical protein
MGRKLTYERDDESTGERLDRHWNELLQELRLVQTGTQILFAFLLGIAFQTQFHTADGFTHAVYAGTLIAAALAVALSSWRRSPSTDSCIRKACATALSRSPTGSPEAGWCSSSRRSVAAC